MKTKKTKPAKAQFVPENDLEAARLNISYGTVSVGKEKITVPGDHVELSPGDTDGLQIGGAESFLLSEEFKYLVASFQALYLGHVETMRRELEETVNEVAKTRKHKVMMPSWLAATIDRISDKVTDPDVQRRYLDSDNPKFRLLYLDYVETAAEFGESALMVCRCLREGNALGAATEAFHAGEAAAALDADRLERRTQRAGFERKLPSAVVAAVKQLNADLEAEITKKTPRYRAIAERLEIEADRVRYIIEGPRRKKK